MTGLSVVCNDGPQRRSRCIAQAYAQGSTPAQARAG